MLNFRHNSHMRRKPERVRSARAPRSPRAIGSALAIVAALALVCGFATPAVAETRPAQVVAEVAPTSVESVATALAGFNPSNLISDALFYDGAAMTTAQIQAFLNQKIGTCTNGKCLNVLQASFSSRGSVVSARTGNQVCAPVTGGTMSVAEAIYRLQVACGISAKVILVTLQKEQGLVTSRAPSDWNIRAAMGANCPDTAPCDPAYAGIGPQLVGGITQLKTYKAGAFARQPGTHFIGYHPNAACGGTNLLISNYATAALYNYTPYQPNAAALAAGYGTGNSCSSYGNRNFYNYYTDWFGSAAVPELASLDQSPHVVALDGNGTLWAYPISDDGRWGIRVAVAQGLGLSKLLPVGDLNGDGNRDIVGVDSSGGAWLLRGDGGLAYGAPTRLNADFSSAVLTAAGGDMNGDGHPDVFTTDAAGALLLWRGTERGLFRSPIQVGRGWQNMDLITGGIDFSGDGIPDLIARSKTGLLYVYLGDGKGGFKSALQIGNGWSGMTSIFSPGEFSGDSIPDIMARDASGRLWLYRGVGGGRIAGTGVSNTGWEVMADIAGPGAVVGTNRVHPAGVGDVSGDGAPDIVGITPAGAVTLYPTTGTGAWGVPRVIASVAAGSRPVALGDFDGDGQRDVGVIAPNGMFTMIRGTATGPAAESQTIGNGWGIFDAVIGGLDFDGDRLPDVLARTPDGQLRLYRGNGSGRWLEGYTIVGSGWQVMDDIVYAGDFDGDGRGDVIARRTDGALLLYPFSAGVWGEPRQIGNGWAHFTALSAPGDFDGTGGGDVLARDDAGRLHIYRGNGKGGWTGSAVVGWGWLIMDRIL